MSALPTSRRTGSAPRKVRPLLCEPADSNRIQLRHCTLDVSDRIAVSDERLRCHLLDALTRQWVYDMLATSRYRTYDPEAATLFYIPVHSTRWLHQNLERLGWRGVDRHAFCYLR